MSLAYMPGQFYFNITFVCIQHRFPLLSGYWISQCSEDYGSDASFSNAGSTQLLLPTVTIVTDVNVTFLYEPVYRCRAAKT